MPRAQDIWVLTDHFFCCVTSDVGEGAVYIKNVGFAVGDHHPFVGVIEDFRR